MDRLTVMLATQVMALLLLVTAVWLMLGSEQAQDWVADKLGTAVFWLRVMRQTVVYAAGLLRQKLRRAWLVTERRMILLALRLLGKGK